MSNIWHRLRHLLVHKVLHADDSSHSIALGASIAVFVAILPLIGLQTILSVAIAALVRANKAICVPLVWVSNPITMWPLYAGCYAVGRFVLTAGATPESAKPLVDLAAPVNVASWFELQFWIDLLRKLAGVGVEIWIGSVIIGAVAAIVTYPLMRWIVIAYRARRHRHMQSQTVFKVPAAVRSSEVA